MARFGDLRSSLLCERRSENSTIISLTDQSQVQIGKLQEGSKEIQKGVRAGWESQLAELLL